MYYTILYYTCTGEGPSQCQHSVRGGRRHGAHRLWVYTGRYVGVRIMIDKLSVYMRHKYSVVL